MLTICTEIKRLQWFANKFTITINNNSILCWLKKLSNLSNCNLIFQKTFTEQFMLTYFVYLFNSFINIVLTILQFKLKQIFNIYNNRNFNSISKVINK